MVADCIKAYGCASLAKQPFISGVSVKVAAGPWKLGAASSILAHPTIKNFRDVAQSGSAPALGAGGRWFKSTYPDQGYMKKLIKRFLKWIAKGAEKEPPHCGKCKSKKGVNLF